MLLASVWPPTKEGQAFRAARQREEEATELRPGGSGSLSDGATSSEE